MVMIGLKQTLYLPQYSLHCTRTFLKKGLKKVPDFNSKQAYNSGWPYNPSNQCTNNYPSASEYNVRTRKNRIDG